MGLPYPSNFGPFSPAVPVPMTPGIPMTPGMPGFTMENIPQTPPAFPHHLLSPGVGPFSPPLAGGPFMPTAAFTPGAPYHPHMNPAPGAPLHMQGGAGGHLGFQFPPTGREMPPTPHWSQVPQQGRQTTRLSDASIAPEVQAPGEGRIKAKEAATAASSAGDAGFGSSSTQGAESSAKDGGYPFPIVAPSIESSALLQRRASTNSGNVSAPVTSSHSANGDGKPAKDASSPATERRGSLAASALLSSEDASANTAELTNAIARMSVQGTALAKKEAKEA